MYIRHYILALALALCAIATRAIAQEGALTPYQERPARLVTAGAPDDDPSGFVTDLAVQTVRSANLSAMKLMANYHRTLEQATSHQRPAEEILFNVFYRVFAEHVHVGSLRQSERVCSQAEFIMGRMYARRRGDGSRVCDDLKRAYLQTVTEEEREKIARRLKIRHN